MRGRWAAPADRARQELHAARVLLEAGLPSQAVAHAAEAVHQIAVAALDIAGETAETDAGVISAFGRRVVVEGGLDRELGRAARKLFEDRRHVDRALLDATPHDARRAIAEAERLLDATRRWIARRARPPAAAAR